jgi:hypothetical protein
MSMVTDIMLWRIRQRESRMMCKVVGAFAAFVVGYLPITIAMEIDHYVNFPGNPISTTVIIAETVY